jgi:phosphoribosyl 1,2-cyclic phosphodiesterase
VHLTILGSGSAGNCAYLEAGETRLLIDAGFSGRQIRQRLAGIGRSPENINGILITHEHSDHIQGLGAIAAKLGIPVYCNRLTMEAIVTIVESPLDFRIITNGSPFEIGEVGVEAFSIPHDANDPVGYLLRTNEGNIGFMTDLGHATKLVLERVRPANVLVLESNHDVKMLQSDTRRPWSLKQRILSRHGHLSNEAAAEAAAEIMSAGLRKIFLSHLSRDCNTPDLALKAMTARLKSLGVTHVEVHTAMQETPCPTVDLAALLARV